MIQITKAVGLKEVSFNPAVLFVEMEDGSVRKFFLTGDVPGVTLLEDVLTLNDSWTEMTEEVKFEPDADAKPPQVTKKIRKTKAKSKEQE